MAASAAAIETLFWVAHGAVERLFQRIIFEDMLVDKVGFYMTVCRMRSYLPSN
jgi:hypothetical protein